MTRSTSMQGFFLQVFSLLAAVVLVSGITTAQEPPAVPTLPSALSTLDIPLPDLSDYVIDTDAAIALGKALFWDVQVGSDGQVACATCHYHAGVDHRVKNTVNPHDADFEMVSGAGRCLTGLAFLDPAEKDIDDIVGSQGVRDRAFTGILEGVIVDCGDVLTDSGFGNNRQVTGRQAPTVINAIYNHRSFWDGRAQNHFNGVNPFGDRDPDANVLHVVAGVIEDISISLENSSLASQAVGPPNSNVEMAWGGRTFKDIGKKLFALVPLGQQEVNVDDSVLAALVDASGIGLDTDYQTMIQNAFATEWWDSADMLTADGVVDAAGEYNLMESNFSLFWGLAVMLYESTLVSDDSPFDQYQSGDDTALTESQIRGSDVFLDKGKCVQCHKGPVFTGATVDLVGHGAGAASFLSEGVIENMIMGDLDFAFYDNGFYNIGVRPTSEDVGVGGMDPFGNPLSFSRRVQLQGIDLSNETSNNSIGTNDRVAVDGAFKTPTLRNVELTGPFFHNGRYATLSQVIDFYQRGGNVTPLDGGGDTTGTGTLGEGDGTGGSNLDPDVETLGLTAQEEWDLRNFLIALTDQRVKNEEAPFDHPELQVANGKLIPAVGAGGLPDLDLPGLVSFKEDLGVGCDGIVDNPVSINHCTPGAAPEGEFLILKARYNVGEDRWVIRGTTANIEDQTMTAYLGSPGAGTLIGEAGIRSDGIWKIITADFSGPDGDAADAPSFITVISSIGEFGTLDVEFVGN